MSEYLVTPPPPWDQTKVSYPGFFRPLSAGDLATLTPLRPKPCNSNPPEAENIPLYLVLRKIFGAFGAKKHHIYPYFCVLFQFQAI